MHLEDQYGLGHWIDIVSDAKAGVLPPLLSCAPFQQKVLDLQLDLTQHGAYVLTILPALQKPPLPPKYGVLCVLYYR